MRANARAPPPDAFATSPRAFAGYGSRRARVVDARARRRRRRARSIDARSTVSRARVASRARRASTPRARPFARARRIGRRTRGATSRAPCFAPVTSKSPRPRRARTRSPRAASPRERSGVYERGACLLPFTTYNPFYIPFKEIQPIYSTRGKTSPPSSRASAPRASVSFGRSPRAVVLDARDDDDDDAGALSSADARCTTPHASRRSTRPSSRATALPARRRPSHPLTHNLEIAIASTRPITRASRASRDASLRMGLYPKL